MKNFIQAGESIDYSNSGSAISSGDIVVIGERIAVADGDIATNSNGTLHLEGVYNLPKATSETHSVGDKLFYSVGTGKLTKTATGNIYAGYAFKDAGSSDTTNYCKLDAKPKQVAVQADSTASDVAGLKADVNALLAKLKAAGVMANS